MKIARHSPWPCGLIGMFCLICTLEWSVRRHELVFLTHLASDWQTAGRSAGKVADFEVVALGDSLLKHGVIPPVVDEALGVGRRSHNLALPGGSPPASYFLLRRMIARGLRPRVVLADGELLDSDPLTRARVWPELVTPGEFAELSWSAGDAGYFARTAIGWLLPTFRARAELRQGVSAALDGKALEEPRSLAARWRNGKRNAGALVLPDRDDLSGPDPRPGELDRTNYSPGRWTCSPLNELYADRLIDLAGQHGIEVVWLLPPAHPEALARRVRGGWAASHEAFLIPLLSRFPNLTVVSAWNSDYPAEAFADMTHLSRTGAIALSHSLGAFLRARLDGENSPRWVNLPRYDRFAAGTLAVFSSVEDIRMSNQLLATKDPKTSERSRLLNSPTRR